MFLLFCICGIDEEEHVCINSKQPSLVTDAMKNDDTEEKADLPKSVEIEEKLRISDVQLGAGAFSQVYVGSYKGGKIAVKCASMYCKYAQNEIHIIQNIPFHTNIIRMLTYFHTDSKTCLVYEIADCDLLSTIENDKPLSEDNAREYFIQLLDGMHHMHSHNIIHGDIKLENLLLCEKTLKIADFGLSRQIEVNVPITGLRGTLPYCSPNTLSGNSYDAVDADLWSVSICLFALVCGFFPYETATNQDWRFVRIYMKSKQLVEELHKIYKKQFFLSKGIRHLLHTTLIMEGNVSLQEMVSHEWCLADKTKIDNTGDTEKTGSMQILHEEIDNTTGDIGNPKSMQVLHKEIDNTAGDMANPKSMQVLHGEIDNTAGDMATPKSMQVFHEEIANTTRDIENPKTTQILYEEDNIVWKCREHTVPYIIRMNAAVSATNFECH